MPRAALDATDLSRPGRIAGRSTGSSARSAFVARTTRSMPRPRRVRSVSAIKGSVMASECPSPTMTSATSRRARWRGVSPPPCSVVCGRVRGIESSPMRRPTSSTMSISRTRSGRNVGAIARNASGSSGVSSTSMPSGASDPRTCVPSRSSPSTAATRAGRTRIRSRSTTVGYSSIAGGPIGAPATSVSSSTTRSDDRNTPFGSTPRSKRALASERRPSRFDVIEMPIGAKHATSSTIPVVPSWTSASAPPMIPAIAWGRRSASQMSRSDGRSFRSTPSSVVSDSPASATRTTSPGPRRRSRSNAWDGWPRSSIT